jgi:L-arabinose isomerase
MAAWSARTRTVVHHEWTLAKPAHHTEVTSAIAAAERAHDAEQVRITDITVTADDELIIVAYTTEEPTR